MNRLNVLPMTRLRAWRAPLGRSAVKSQGVTGTPEGRARFSRLAARFSSEAGVPVSRGILSPAPLSPAAPPLAPPASPMMAITEISKSATNPPTYVFSPTRLVPKVALIEEFRLPFRDLRKLDAGFGEQHPTVMVRPESGAILVSLEDIRCIITADRAILCDPDPASNGGLIPSPPHEAVDPSALPDMRAHPPPFHPPRTNSASRRALLRTLKSALQTSGKSSTLYTNNTTDELPSTVPAPPDAPTPPFEFLILETILQSVVSLLHARLSALQPQLVHTLRQIQLQHITHTTLESLLRLDRELTALHDSLDALQTAILEVLGNDADMAGMYLTHRLAHPPRAVAEHEEIELLFESYLKQTSELLSRVSGLQSHKKATEQLTALFLDHQRNTLLRFDTQLNMGTLSLAIAAFGTGVFGMNLESGVESSPLGLWMVGVACTALGATAWLRLRRRMIEILKFGGR